MDEMVFINCYNFNYLPASFSNDFNTYGIKMFEKISYDESLDSEMQFKKFVATQAPENHEISDEDVEHMEMANLIDLEIQDHEKFMNQVRDSYCEYDSYDDYLIEEQYMDKIEELLI